MTSQQQIPQERQVPLVPRSIGAHAGSHPQMLENKLQHIDERLFEILTVATYARSDLSTQRSSVDAIAQSNHNLGANNNYLRGQHAQVTHELSNLNEKHSALRREMDQAEDTIRDLQLKNQWCEEELVKHRDCHGEGSDDLRAKIQVQEEQILGMQKEHHEALVNAAHKINAAEWKLEQLQRQGTPSDASQSPIVVQKFPDDADLQKEQPRRARKRRSRNP